MAMIKHHFTVEINVYNFACREDAELILKEIFHGSPSVAVESIVSHPESHLVDDALDRLSSENERLNLLAGRHKARWRNLYQALEPIRRQIQSSVIDGEGATKVFFSFGELRKIFEAMKSCERSKSGLSPELWDNCRS